MPFAGRTSAAPAPASAAAPYAPAPSYAPAPPAAPYAPPAPAAPPRMLWAVVNGQTVEKTEVEARALPPTTPAMFKGESTWSTIGAILPAAPAAHAPAPQYGAPGQPQVPAQSGVPAGLFAGVESAQVNRRGNNLNQGEYVAKLLSAEYKQGRKGNYIILEMLCLVSSYDPANPATHSCNAEGSTFTVFVSKNESFASNIKEIILALSGFDEQGHPRDENDTVTQAECEQLVSTAQPFSKAIVYLEAKEITTRAGKPFTRINWWPCPLLPDGNPDLTKISQGR